MCIEKYNRVGGEFEQKMSESAQVSSDSSCHFSVSSFIRVSHSLVWSFCLSGSLTPLFLSFLSPSHWFVMLFFVFFKRFYIRVIDPKAFPKKCKTQPPVLINNHPPAHTHNKPYTLLITFNRCLHISMVTAAVSMEIFNKPQWVLLYFTCEMMTGILVTNYLS